MTTEKTSRNTGWSTGDELAFVRGIGTFSELAPSPSRTQLLRQYRTALMNRADWGGIDQARVLMAVDSQLAIGV